MRNNAPQYVKPRLALETPSSGNPPDVPFIHFASDDNPPPKRTIRGQRRRPGSDRPSSGRAEDVYKRQFLSNRLSFRIRIGFAGSTRERGRVPN